MLLSWILGDGREREGAGWEGKERGRIREKLEMEVWVKRKGTREEAREERQVLKCCQNLVLAIGPVFFYASQTHEQFWKWQLIAWR